MLMLQLCYCTVLLIGTYPHRIVVVSKLMLTMYLQYTVPTYLDT